MSLAIIRSIILTDWHYPFITLVLPVDKESPDGYHWDDDLPVPNNELTRSKSCPLITPTALLFLVTTTTLN